MNYKAIKDEIQNIIYGKSGNSQKTLIRTVADYLRASERASTLVKKDKHYKQEEKKRSKQEVDLNIINSPRVDNNA